MWSCWLHWAVNPRFHGGRVTLLHVKLGFIARKDWIACLKWMCFECLVALRKKWAVRLMDVASATSPVMWYHVECRCGPRYRLVSRVKKNKNTNLYLDKWKVWQHQVTKSNKLKPEDTDRKNHSKQTPRHNKGQRQTDTSHTRMRKSGEMEMIQL